MNEGEGWNTQKEEEYVSVCGREKLDGQLILWIDEPAVPSEHLLGIRGDVAQHACLGATNPCCAGEKRVHVLRGIMTTLLRPDLRPLN